MGGIKLAGLYVRLAVDAGRWERNAFLERLLAIAPAPQSLEDWRVDAQAFLVPPDRSRLASASILHRSLAAGAAPDRGFVLLISPLHTTATMSSVRLPADGLLHLDPAQARLLAEDHARHLGGKGRFQLIAGSRGELLLWSEDVLEAPGVDPAMQVGQDLRDAWPRGAGAARLLAWSSEVQLWLFDHPVNRGRVAAQQLPITMLWPWGGGGVMPRLPPRPFELTGGDEVFGLWPCAPGPAPDSRVFVAGGEAGDFAVQVAALESPLRRMLRSGAAVCLSAGRLRYTLYRLPRRWLARRDRPWWEYFWHDD